MKKLIILTFLVTLKSFAFSQCKDLASHIAPLKKMIIVDQRHEDGMEVLTGYIHAPLFGNETYCCAEAQDKYCPDFCADEGRYTVFLFSEYSDGSLNENVKISMWLLVNAEEAGGDCGWGEVKDNVYLEKDDYLTIVVKCMNCNGQGISLSFNIWKK